MTVPFTFPDTVFVRVTKDADTAPELEVYDGVLLGLTAAQVAALPTTPDTITVGTGIEHQVTVPGYKRTMPDGSVQWVMSTVDPNQAMILTLPRPTGWASPDAENTWISMGLELRNRGITPADLNVLYPALFAAARAEIQAGG
jgi:hypothetical protein